MPYNDRIPYLSSILLLLLLAIGCSKSDDNDLSEDEFVFERTEIIMDAAYRKPARDFDWKNAKMAWSENFDQPELSDVNWSYSENSANPDVADQWQTYNESDAQIVEGNLWVQAKKSGVGQKKGDYTSSRISSNFAFQYGRFEIRAKLPQGEKNGIWARLSLIGEDRDSISWPASGEINLMEYLSHRPDETYITVHSEANNSTNENLISWFTDLEAAEEEFHTYGLLWTADYLKFYIDDVDNITYTLNRPSPGTEANWPFDKPFFLLVDLVVGGQYGGAEGVDDAMFPAVMEIEYMRVLHAQ